MYKNILLPIVFDHEEGTRKAFDAARLLADPSAKFTVMHIMETIPGYVRGQIPDEVFETRRKEMELSLAQIAAELTGATAALVSGHAANTIVGYAGEHDVDCIIMSSHTSGLESFFLGSTANKVVHHAGCSVHVIR